MADMKMIVRWQTMVARHPFAAMVILTAVFTACVFWANALNAAFYYDRQAPGTLVAFIIVLYLSASLVFGLITPSRCGTLPPALGYISGMWLWPLVPGEGYDDLTYDSGWAGAVLYTLAPAFIVWLVSITGWNLAGRKRNSP